MAIGAKANVTQYENEIERDSVRARQCGDVVGCIVTNNACMGHSDWVNKRVHETGGTLVECDGLDATQWLRRALTSSPRRH